MLTESVVSTVVYSPKLTGTCDLKWGIPEEAQGYSCPQCSDDFKFRGPESEGQEILPSGVRHQPGFFHHGVLEPQPGKCSPGVSLVQATSMSLSFHPVVSFSDSVFYLKGVSQQTTVSTSHLSDLHHWRQQYWVEHQQNMRLPLHGLFLKEGRGLFFELVHSWCPTTGPVSIHSSSGFSPHALLATSF